MEASTRNRHAGWLTFAGVMFIVGGVANLVWGIGALGRKSYLPESGLLFSTLTFWGWVAIIWAVVVLIGAYLLLSKSPSGPVIGIVLATISAIFWLLTLPVLPIFSLTVLIIDALIIYGLARVSEAS